MKNQILKILQDKGLIDLTKNQTHLHFLERTVKGVDVIFVNYYRILRVSKGVFLIPSDEIAKILTKELKQDVVIDSINIVS